jgi:predicted homoserine dehydrogenase-like protein
MRERLMALEEAATPIRVAIIGCGWFGSGVVSQIRRAPGMDISVVCDIDGRRAVQVLGQAGYDTGGLVTTSRVAEANDSIRRGAPVATENVDVAIQADVDVVVEVTGNPDAGARHAFEAIMAGKHVVNVTVEADVLVGPLLRQMADRAGLVYSLVYGDQPGNIEELYDWAVSVGFEVVAAGKGTKYLPEYRKGAPDDASLRYGYPPDEVPKSTLNPEKYNSFQDGTASAIEMCAVANMTGLVPDVPGMHTPPASVEEIPSLLIPAEDGGILSRKGVVEVVSCLREDGSDIPNSLPWGVYVVITSDSPYLLSCLRDKGVAMDPSGTYGLMYRPYHLVGMEAPISIAKAFLYGEPTGAPKGMVAEVAAAAKQALEPGDVLGGEGGFTVYGALVEAPYARQRNLLPIGLCAGARVTRRVAEDQMLNYDDVEMLAGGFAHHLRRLQDQVAGFHDTGETGSPDRS